MSKTDSDDTSRHAREGGHPAALKTLDSRLRGNDGIAGRVLEFVRRLPATTRLIVAYSGGVDSHVLLHVLAASRAALSGVELHALHVDHGLNPFSVEWSRHGQRTCATLNVPCTVVKVDARPRDDESPEAAARRARYAAFEQFLRAGDVLLTAHHQDDQAETVLLQLLRGAGPRGLAAMPPRAPLGSGWLARPLLDVTRDELHAYAERHALRWIDDPSNGDSRFDRNFLRTEILPRLKQRWPAATATIARGARHSAEAAELLDELAALDWTAARSSTHDAEDASGPSLPRKRESSDLRSMLPGSGDVSCASSLSIVGLESLSIARRRNLLRYWIGQLGLPAPGAAHLEQVERLLAAADDAQPLVHWPGAEVRRYREHLYAMPPLEPFDATRELAWDLRAPLPIAGLGVLHARAVTGNGLRAARCASGVTVRFRRGGERLRPAGRRETHTLKHLLQDAGIPPWRRERWPLLFVGDTLAAVPGLWIDAAFAAHAGEPAWNIEWRAE